MFEAAIFIEWADSHHASMISFETSSRSTPPAVFLDREAGAEQFVGAARPRPRGNGR
jgi:hypothetical protein